MKYLIPLLFPIAVFAETTGNLIINSGFDNNTLGWTLSGDATRIGDCCPGGHDIEFGDYGSIEQDVNLLSNNITQPMLNNGISLHSIVEVQNGEGGIGGWAPNRGSADSFTIRLQIKDENQNVLATTTQTRQDVTGINGQDYSNTVTYTGAGSNIGNIFISGSDAAAPANLGGPNVDNIRLSLEYDPTVLTVQQTQEIQEIFEEIEEAVEVSYEYVPEEIETFEIQEIETFTELPEIVEVIQEEEFIEETIVLAPEIIQQQIIEEPTTEVVEEEFNEITEETLSPLGSSEREVSETEADTSAPSEETNDNSGRTEVAINVDDIANKVANKIKTIDGQLRATQFIVAKVMAKNNKAISAYSQINSEIFNQPNIIDTNIDVYLNNTYVDIRNIYQNVTYEDRNGY